MLDKDISTTEFVAVVLGGIIWLVGMYLSIQWIISDYPMELGFGVFTVGVLMIAGGITSIYHY